MELKPINPKSLGMPRGYSNGIVAPTGGSLLFISGQIGWDEKQKLISSDFVEQFDRALANVITVVEEAGARAKQIVRLTIYVTDKREYTARGPEIGDRYRQRMGRHFPAMALVEVQGLLEDSAKVEIEGMAVF